MKPKDKDKSAPTLYDESYYKPRISIVKIVSTVLLVLLVLSVVRFFNQVLWWNVTKWELTASKKPGGADVIFLGFSNYEKAQKKLLAFSAARSTKKIAVSYFDLVRPVVFLLNNRGGRDFVNFGLLNVYVEPGISALFFYAAEIIQVKHQTVPPRALYFGSSLSSPLFRGMAKQNSAEGEKGKDAASGLSYILNPIENSKYLRIPYEIYFFLPLVLILVLSVHYGGVFFISFFYYLEFFLLFDFKRVLLLAPFSRLLNLLGVKPSLLAAAIISALIALLFTAAAFMGLRVFFNRKKDPTERPLSPLGRGLLLFFLLLPLFLRF